MKMFRTVPRNLCCVCWNSRRRFVLDVLFGTVASHLRLICVWLSCGFVSYVSDCLASGMRPWANFNHIGSLAFWLPTSIGLLLAFCRNLPFHCMPTLNSTSTYEMKPRSSKWPYMHDVRLQKTCFHDVIIMVCVWWFSHWKCENRENRVKTVWKPCENRSKNCENRKFAL